MDCPTFLLILLPSWPIKSFHFRSLDCLICLLLTGMGRGVSAFYYLTVVTFILSDSGQQIQNLFNYRKLKLWVALLQAISPFGFTTISSQWIGISICLLPPIHFFFIVLVGYSGSLIVRAGPLSLIMDIPMFTPGNSGMSFLYVVSSLVPWGPSIPLFRRESCWLGSPTIIMSCTALWPNIGNSSTGV